LAPQKKYLSKQLVISKIHDQPLNYSSDSMTPLGAWPIFVISKMSLILALLNAV